MVWFPSHWSNSSQTENYIWLDAALLEVSKPGESSVDLNLNQCGKAEKRAVLGARGSVALLNGCISATPQSNGVMLYTSWADAAPLWKHSPQSCSRTGLPSWDSLKPQIVSTKEEQFLQAKHPGTRASLVAWHGLHLHGQLWSLLDASSLQ